MAAFPEDSIPSTTQQYTTVCNFRFWNSDILFWILLTLIIHGAQTYMQQSSTYDNNEYSKKKTKYFERAKMIGSSFSHISSTLKHYFPSIAREGKQNRVIKLTLQHKVFQN